MFFGKKVVVPVDIDNDVITLLHPLREMEFLKHSEIHFVHVFNTFNYTTVFADFPMIYPVEGDLNGIEESVNAFMKKTGQKVIPDYFTGKFFQKCLFSERPKEKFCEYVKELKADLIIVPTRLKHGVFESSFALYANKHTTANMIFLKDRMHS